MHSTTFWLVTVLASLVAAQFNSSNLSVPPSVDGSLKSQWCLAERNACPLLCGGQDFTQANNCVGVDLPKFDCLCKNGTAPANMADYIGSIQNSICVATFQLCRQQTPGSTSCPNCGKLDPSDAPKGVASTSIASSTTTTSATGAATVASVAPTTTSGAVAHRPDSVLERLIMGVLAALGLLL